MQNPKHGDIATNKNDKNQTRKVLGVVDEIVFLSEEKNHTMYDLLYSLSDFHKYYTIQQPKRVPKADEMYWFIGDRGVGWTANDEMPGNEERIALGNCYQTEEEAKFVWEKVKGCY